MTLLKIFCTVVKVAESQKFFNFGSIVQPLKCFPNHYFEHLSNVDSAKDSDLAHFLRVEYLSEIKPPLLSREFKFKFFDKRPDGKQKELSENY